MLGTCLKDGGSRIGFLSYQPDQFTGKGRADAGGGIDGGGMIRAELESILCGGTRSASASDVQVEAAAQGIITGAAAYSLSEALGVGVGPRSSDRCASSGPQVL